MCLLLLLPGRGAGRAAACVSRLLPRACVRARSEYRVLAALRRHSSVPVPEVYALCEDTGVIGSAFYIMEFVQGRVFKDPALPTLPVRERSAVYASVLATLGAIHGVDVDAAGLRSFGTTGGFFARQVRRLGAVSLQQAAHAPPLPRLDEMCAWLSGHLPHDATTLVHGDYKLDNLIFHETECRVVAVLDWEMATLGHPLSDLANLCMGHEIPRMGPVLGMRGLDLRELGIPAVHDIVGDYGRAAAAAATGAGAGAGAGAPVREEDWRFAVAFQAFKSAVILQGIAARAARGNASSAQAATFGALAPMLAGGAAERMGLPSDYDAAAPPPPPPRALSKL